MLARFTKDITIGYVIAKMQEGYSLHFARLPYQSCLRSPEGGHSRNVSNMVIERAKTRRLIRRVPGGRGMWFSVYELTTKGSQL